MATDCGRTATTAGGNRGQAPSVYLVMLNWNSWSDTLEALESLAHCSYPELHVVVVDNDSSDDSVARIEAWCRSSSVPCSEPGCNGTPPAPRHREAASPSGVRELMLLRAGANLGFCAGNNAGCELALQRGADFLLILNNDTLCEPDFVDQLVCCSQGNGNGCVTGGMIYRADDRQSVWWGGQELRRFYRHGRRFVPPPRENGAAGGMEVSWVTGCLMLIPQEVYRRVGGFDERFFLWHEDIDLSLRVLEKGYRLLLSPRARIYHKVSRSIGRVSPLAYYYSARNFLLLSRSHNRASWHLLHLLYFLGRWGITSLWLLSRGRRLSAVAGWAGVGDYFLGRFGKARQHDRICAWHGAGAGAT